MPSEAAPDTLDAKGHGNILTYKAMGLSMGFPIMHIYLERKGSKSPAGQTESRSVLGTVRHCSDFILMKETPMTQTVLNN